MHFLFVHQYFPGQYLHLAPALAARGHSVTALGMGEATMPGVDYVRYGLKRGNAAGVHPWAAEFESKVLRGEAAARAALQLKEKGFMPDLICAHPGWGEALFLKDVWPRAKLLCFCEFYYHARGADLNFDPEFPAPGFDGDARLRSKNAAALLSLEVADWGVSPTRWQKSQFPAWALPRISVIHDGIDTELAKPDPGARMSFTTADGEVQLAAGDEVVTFVSRNLEPYRGYHVFMRALPELLRRRPKARVMIVGGQSVSYGPQAPEGKTWMQIFLDEVAADLGSDRKRVHFLGNIPHSQFVNLLQIAAAHVYLTYPFVLSWSLLEAMSAGCLIVASRTPPVEEVVRNGENGLLVDFFRPQELAVTVAEALARPGNFAKMRARARADIVARYDLRSGCLLRHVELAEGLGRGEALGDSARDPI